MEDAAKKRQIEFVLWVTMLGPPIAWLTDFQILYSNVLPACVSHTKTGLIITSLLCLAVTLGSGLLAWRELRYNPAPDEVVKSRRFMSYVGLMTSGLFSLVVIAQAIAVLLVNPCHL